MNASKSGEDAAKGVELPAWPGRGAPRSAQHRADPGRRGPRAPARLREDGSAPCRRPAVLEPCPPSSRPPAVRDPGRATKAGVPFALGCHWFGLKEKRAKGPFPTPHPPCGNMERNAQTSVGASNVFGSRTTSRSKTLKYVSYHLTVLEELLLSVGFDVKTTGK